MKDEEKGLGKGIQIRETERKKGEMVRRKGEKERRKRQHRKETGGRKGKNKWTIKGAMKNGEKSEKGKGKNKSKRGKLIYLPTSFLFSFLHVFPYTDFLTIVMVSFSFIYLFLFHLTNVDSLIFPLL